LNKEDYTKAEQSELLLVNIVEELVRQTVDYLISTMAMCDCNICRLNACAIALNALNPHYVTTTKGALLTRIPSEMKNYQAQILVEATKALMIVKENPLH
jgi:competence protein ComFB